MAENLNIQLEYKEINCKNFVNSDGRKEEATVVIMPLRIVEDEANSMTRISTGCNMWKNCQNTNCQFSKQTMDLGRK